MTNGEFIGRFITCFDDMFETAAEKNIAYGSDDNEFTFNSIKNDYEKHGWYTNSAAYPDYFTKCVDYILGFYADHEFHFCGCGRADTRDMRKYIYDMLLCFVKEDGDDERYWLNRSFFKSRIGKREDTDGMFSIEEEFILHWLYSVNLTDHSVSIYTSYLTENGILLRYALLNPFLIEDIDKLWQGT